MRIIPTLEDIQDSKGSGEQRFLTSMERDLLELKRLHRICGNKKLWHEVMPTGREVAGTEEWLWFDDMCQEMRASEIKITAEYLARKKGWLKAAAEMRMPGGWKLSEAFCQVPGYSPGYYGNPVTPMSSPYKMQLWGWRVWTRACAILRPYGWRPSRNALEAALISHAGNFHRSGKIALRVAAASLPVMFGGGLACDAFRGHNAPSSLPGLRQARQVLIKARGWGALRKRWDHDQEVMSCICQMVRYGVPLNKAEEIVIDTLFSRPLDEDQEGFTLSAPEKIKSGIQLQRCFVYDHGYEDQRRPWLNRANKWSVSDKVLYSWPGTSYNPYHGYQGELDKAIRAWKAQKRRYEDYMRLFHLAAKNPE